MPFGPDCEYADMKACAAANSDKDDPEAYCATIMRATEEHCQKAVLGILGLKPAVEKLRAVVRSAGR